RRSATIRSKGRSIVKVFPGDKLGEVLENYPDISKQIIDTLVLRLNESSNRLSEIMQNRLELERTYVNQLTTSVGAMGMQSARPIAAAPKGQIAAAPAAPAVATATKQSALAKLAAKQAGAAAGASAKPAASGGNGSAGQATIRPVPKLETGAQTALANSVSGRSAQISARPQSAGANQAPPSTISQQKPSASIVPPAAAGQAAAPPTITPTPPPAAPPTIAPASSFVPPVAVPIEDPPEVLVEEIQTEIVQAPVRASQPRPAPPLPPKMDASATRPSFARNMMPADQTQLVIMKEAAPAAKILREVRSS
ncbi:MAG: hypothetical protein LBJ64_03890, partial [Deltaproteobacteria bacterium]|nr:hypothetical protein [Deltaproteobacteria bacterium]